MCVCREGVGDIHKSAFPDCKEQADEACISQPKVTQPVRLFFYRDYLLENQQVIGEHVASAFLMFCWTLSYSILILLYR